jgi:hypothetical protein
MHEITTAVIKELQLYDVRHEIVDGHHGKKIAWTINGRPTRSLPLPTNGHRGDPRAPLNARAQVRRWLREDGAKKAEPVHKEPTVLQKALQPNPEDLLPLYDRLRKAEADIAALTDLFLDHVVHPVDVEVTVNGLPLLGRRSSLPRMKTTTAGELPKPKTERRPSVEARILRVLEYGPTKSPTEIGAAVGIGMNHAAAMLSKMVREDKVARVSRGQYRKLPRP